MKSFTRNNDDSPQSKHIKMPLQSRVYCETAGSRIHAGNEHDVLYVFQCQSGSVVPVFIVHILSDEGVRLHGAVRIDLYVKIKIIV